jgi:predicted rRNA methylase YqxC with S4 and FtsJ domains
MRQAVRKGGIVRDSVAVEKAMAAFRDWCSDHGYEVAGETPSALPGAEGNQEFFFHLRPEPA